ncbi:MAG: folylpolyglutamate synthase/dihydrofolate synthase family protein [Gallionellaceae bacterium]|jgi:dihydrofolate synthase/folylpolyglutamate synthase
MLTSLSDWLSYLESLHPKTIELGLERVARVKQRLNLQAEFPIIIVGGTNGKGSVCAMLESMLHAAGYRVGCYTSPHILEYNERVRMGKKQASDAQLCAAFAEIEQARKGVSQSAVLAPGDEKNPSTDLDEISLTYFEFATLSAMLLFINDNVDVAILEVGLGGRLDAVNVFDADCAVVTSIDIDHTDYLGDTREQIAFEKAGIFRTGKVAVFGDADMPAAIRIQAEKIGAKLWCIGHEFAYTAQQGQWDYRSSVGTRSALPFPALRGAYQLNNASAALAVLDALKERFPVSMEALRRGLLEVTLPARFQMVPGKPTLILDVAHNPHAAHSLAANLAALPPCQKTYAVLAMLKDKDMAGVVAALKKQVDVWLVAGINAPRGASAEELGPIVENARAGEVLRFNTVSEAVNYAYSQAGENDRIAALGSFYTVAEVMRVRSLHCI